MKVVTSITSLKLDSRTQSSSDWKGKYWYRKYLISNNNWYKSYRNAPPPPPPSLPPGSLYSNFVIMALDECAASHFIFSFQFIAETSGEIICAHCNCMAGLGEVCTHVAAVLFYVETAVKLNGTTTCTQLKCSWVVPSYQADIPYVPIGELDFTSAKTKMKELKGSELSATSTSSLQLSKITAPSDLELDRFYDKLSQTSTKPAILSLVPAHAHKYIPTSKLPNYPKPLQSLYEPSYTSLSYADLLAVCKRSPAIANHRNGSCS